MLVFENALRLRKYLISAIQGKGDFSVIFYVKLKEIA
jgi:hypothetical protein